MGLSKDICSAFAINWPNLVYSPDVASCVRIHFSHLFRLSLNMVLECFCLLLEQIVWKDQSLDYEPFSNQSQSLGG